MTIEKRDTSFWVILNKKESRLLFTQSNFEICLLHDDHSESVIETRQDLEHILSEGYPVGIYLGESNK